MQMTAYEMSISDCSSDVCSSDLLDQHAADDEAGVDPGPEERLVLRVAGGEDRLGRQQRDHRVVEHHVDDRGHERSHVLVKRNQREDQKEEEVGLGEDAGEVGQRERKSVLWGKGGYRRVEKGGRRLT